MIIEDKMIIWKKYTEKYILKILNFYFDKIKSENLFVCYNSYFKEYPKFRYKPTSEDIIFAKNIFKKNIDIKYSKNISDIFTLKSNKKSIEFYMSILDNKNNDNCITSIRLNIKKDKMNLEFLDRFIVIYAYEYLMNLINKNKFIKEEFENKLYDIISFNDAFSDDFSNIDTFDQLYCRVLTEDNDKFVFIPIFYCDGDSYVLDICIDIKDKDGKFYNYYL